MEFKMRPKSICAFCTFLRSSQDQIIPYMSSMRQLGQVALMDRRTACYDKATTESRQNRIV
jgi:hypothetical protein